MKVPFHESGLPQGCVVVMCASYEQRSTALVTSDAGWRPSKAILLTYDSVSPEESANCEEMRSYFATLCPVARVPLAAVVGEVSEGDRLGAAFVGCDETPVVLDISVLSNMYLLVLMQWLDDHGFWDRLWIVYSEPEVYAIEGHLPLSFGVSAVSQLPGFSAASNPSRPVHASLFLGYEGDRALATYEILQPKRTTVIIPDPPFRDSWKGRTEEQNRDLLAAIGDQGEVERADAVDPQSSETVLCRVFGDVGERAEYSRVLCPLGTKPQAVGAYMYLRRCVDPPAVVYSWALRHNQKYYSTGVGNRWLIHRPM